MSGQDHWRRFLAYVGVTSGFQVISEIPIARPRDPRNPASRHFRKSHAASANTAIPSVGSRCISRNISAQRSPAPDRGAACIWHIHDRHCSADHGADLRHPDSALPQADRLQRHDGDPDFPLGDQKRLCLILGFVLSPVGPWPRLNNAAP